MVVATCPGDREFLQGVCILINQLNPFRVPNPLTREVIFAPTGLDIGQFEHFTQLFDCESCLQWTATTNQMHTLHFTTSQGFQCILRGIRNLMKFALAAGKYYIACSTNLQIVNWTEQHSRYIHGNVALSHNRNISPTQVWIQLFRSRQTIVPGHKFPR